MQRSTILLKNIALQTRHLHFTLKRRGNQREVEYTWCVSRGHVGYRVFSWNFTIFFKKSFNPLSAKLTKWPNTLKQFVVNLPTNCLSVFGHFMGLARKRLTNITRRLLLPISTISNYSKNHYLEFLQLRILSQI